MSLRNAALKRLLLGRPRASRELEHELLPKYLALPVFAANPLSSVAYATEEMMLVLALAGAAGLAGMRPLSVAVAVLLAVVVVSYRQTLRAYPGGGGAYTVARGNLGQQAGLVAAAALLVDYVLTVAVSVAAGVAAITSALPALRDDGIVLALAFVAVVALANLRGTREAGALSAAPTYAFLAAMLLLITVGLARCLGAGGCPQDPGVQGGAQVVDGLTLFLLLRAFASGATALTGVESISNGVTAFRYPQGQNAAATLAIMAAASVTMFLGISWLATTTGVVVGGEVSRTVLAQIALAVFGEGLFFYVVQAVTAAILVLAANTAFADFPRLASVLAQDRFLPRQLVSRGDRLVFSNGILLLAVAAMLLLVAFGVSVTVLVQLYIVGVFTAFTLSQAGMVRHHLRVRQARWRLGAGVNGLGALVTGAVLMVVVVTKFTGGAWIVLLAIACLVMLMHQVHAHYAAVRLQLRAGLIEAEEPRPNHVAILLDRVDEAAARAVSYVRATQPASVVALAVPTHDDNLQQRWSELAPDVPLVVLQPGDAPHVVRAFLRGLDEIVREHPDDHVTALLPEVLSRSWVDQVRQHRVALRLKAALLRRGRVVVTDLTSPEGGPGPYTLEEPVAHHAVVLVSAVNKATMRALAYARSLQPTSLRALHVNLEVARSMRMLEEWEDWGMDLPLEVVDSPFRSLTDTVRAYVREFEADGRAVIVTCVLPEFVLPHWYQQPLHNQTALLIKGTLLFERGVVTTSVPFRIYDVASSARAVDRAGR